MFPLRTHWSSASSLTASIQLPSTRQAPASHHHQYSHHHLTPSPPYHTITNITPSPISHCHHYHTITIITPSDRENLVTPDHYHTITHHQVSHHHHGTHLTCPPPPSSTSTGPPPLLAVLGKARFYISRYNFKAAMDVLQRSVSTNPAFLPGLIEKMRVELANQQWDSATETANR